MQALASILGMSELLEAGCLLRSTEKYFPSSQASVFSFGASPLEWKAKAAAMAEIFKRIDFN